LFLILTNKKVKRSTFAQSHDIGGSHFSMNPLAMALFDARECEIEKIMR
jgi:hypothetical protein